VRFRDHSLIIGPVHQNEVAVRELVRLFAKNRVLRRWTVIRLWRYLIRGGPWPRRHAAPHIALLGLSHDLPPFLYEPMMRRVVYRQGDGADPASLELVAARSARRAILLASGHDSPDADAITIATLAAFRAVNPHADVFVEVLESGHCGIAESVGEQGAFPLDVSRILGLFLCQHLMVPQIERLYQDLITSRGSEFYTHVFLEAEEYAALERLGEGPDDTLPFEVLAREASLRHRVLLCGVLLGEAKPRALQGWQVPIDHVRLWLNPTTMPGEPARAALAALGARPSSVLQVLEHSLVGLAIELALGVSALENLFGGLD